MQITERRLKPAGPGLQPVQEKIARVAEQSAYTARAVVVIDAQGPTQLVGEGLSSADCAYLVALAQDLELNLGKAVLSQTCREEIL